MRRSPLERSMELLRESGLSETNKQLAIRFKDECLANGLSEGRVSKYLWQVRKLGSWLGMDFDQARIEDIKRVVANIETSPISAWTKCDYKVAIRKFYKWLSGEDDCPKMVRWIRPRPPRGRDMMPTDLLSEDDIKRLIVAADHPRDRALVASLYESGARIGELLDMKIKDLVFDKYGGIAMLDGKTGPRRIRLVSSVPFLTEWLNKHPTVNNRASYIWIRRHHQPHRIDYGRIRMLLLELGSKAGLDKPVNPHHFRHSRATFVANHLTESQMKEYLGWVQASEMAGVYVHLSGRDVDRAVLKLHGQEIEDEEKHENRQLAPKLCPRCQEQNPCANVYCLRCGLPLDEKAAVELVGKESERRRADQMLDLLLDYEEFRADLIRRVRDMARTSGSSLLRYGARTPPQEFLEGK